MTGDATAGVAAGRELNRRVAVEVMGWFDIPGNTMWHLTPDGSWSDKTYNGFHFGPDKDWSPSTDIAAAWLVVERLGMVHIELIHWADSDSWQCNIGGTLDRKPYQMPQSDWQDTANLAICIAALAAAGRIASA